MIRVREVHPIGCGRFRHQVSRLDVNRASVEVEIPQVKIFAIAAESHKVQCRTIVHVHLQDVVVSPIIPPRGSRCLH